MCPRDEQSWDTPRLNTGRLASYFLCICIGLVLGVAMYYGATATMPLLEGGLR